MAASCFSPSVCVILMGGVSSLDGDPLVFEEKAKYVHKLKYIYLHNIISLESSRTTSREEGWVEHCDQEFSQRRFGTVPSCTNQNKDCKS